MKMLSSKEINRIELLEVRKLGVRKAAFCLSGGVAKKLT